MTSMKTWLPFAGALLLFCGFSASAFAQAAPTSGVHRTVCANSVDLAQVKKIIESEKFRPILEAARAAFLAKHPNGLTDTVPHPRSKFFARGRVFGQSSPCNGTRAATSANSLASPDSPGTITQGVISPDPTDPDQGTFYDLGMYGTWEQGDYMEDSDWWDSDVFSPVWEAQLIANDPSQLCLDKYSSCNDKTEFLKDTALAACGGLLEVPAIAGVCLVTVEYLAKKADNQCKSDFAGCVANQ